MGMLITDCTEWPMHDAQALRHVCTSASGSLAFSRRRRYGLAAVARLGRRLAASRRLIASSRQIEARIDPDDAGIGRAEQEVQPLLLAICSRIGNSFFWNSLWSCVCSSLTSACASCWKRWPLDVSAARFPSRAAARAASFMSAAALSAASCWLSCSALAFVARLGLLLL